MHTVETPTGREWHTRTQNGTSELELKEVGQERLGYMHLGFIYTQVEFSYRSCAIRKIKMNLSPRTRKSSLRIYSFISYTCCLSNKGALFLAMKISGLCFKSKIMGKPHSKVKIYPRPHSSRQLSKYTQNIHLPTCLGT